MQDNLEVDTVEWSNYNTYLLADQMPDKTPRNSDDIPLQVNLVEDLTREKGYERIDQDTIITNGDIEIDIINEIFKTKIPDGDDYASLNGLLHERLQDFPQEGDKIEIKELRIVVEKVSKNIPQKIRIEKIKT